MSKAGLFLNLVKGFYIWQSSIQYMEGASDSSYSNFQKPKSNTWWWVLGVIFTLAGLGATQESILSGFFVVLGGLVLLPLTHALLVSRLSFLQKKEARVLSAIVLIFSGFAFSKAGSSSKVEKVGATSTAEVSKSPAQLAEEKAKDEEEKRSFIEKNTWSANDLYQYYQDNEVAADNALKGKDIYVKGRISAIRKDFTDDIIVDLETENMFTKVFCYIDDADYAASLSKGQIILVKGECEGIIMGTPIIKRCAPVNL